MENDVKKDGFYIQKKIYKKQLERKYESVKRMQQKDKWRDVFSPRFQHHRCYGNEWME